MEIELKNALSRTLVELHSSATKTVPETGFVGLEDMYRHFNLPQDGSFWSKREVCDQLLERLLQEISETGTATSISINTMIDEVIFTEFLETVDLNTLINHLYCIREVVRERQWQVVSVAQKERWINAFSIVKDLVAIHDELCEGIMSHARHTFSRQTAIGGSLLTLRRHGVNVEFQDGTLYVDYENATLIAEGKLRGVGGFYAINSLLQNYESRFDSTQHRYHFIRTFGRGLAIPQPDVPVGYIFNLCVKNILPESISANVRGDFCDFIEIVTAMCATLDVQQYNIFTSFFRNGPTIVGGLKEIAVYDSIFTLPQMSPAHFDCFDGLFDWVDNVTLFASAGWTVPAAFSVARHILAQGIDKRGVVEVDFHQLCSDSRVEANELATVLNLFSHSYRAVNKNYTMPQQATDADFGFKPLIVVPPQRYFLPLASWCSLNFYEAIAEGLRASGVKQVTENIGLYQESVVKRLLIDKGVSFSCGNYSVAGIDGECDLMVEASNTIILIEMKAKALTRKAKAGIDAHLLVDIANSLLDSQLQLGRHETLLLEHGMIELEDNGIKHLVELNNKSVERISLTLLEFSGLQDRTTIFNILESVDHLHASQADTVSGKKLNELRDTCDQLREQTLHLKDISSNKNRKPFFNCWFLSLAKLQLILEDVHDNDSFVNSLTMSRHMTAGSQDFYFEHANARRLKDLPLSGKTTMVI